MIKKEKMDFQTLPDSWKPFKKPIGKTGNFRKKE